MSKNKKTKSRTKSRQKTSFISLLFSRKWVRIGLISFILLVIAANVQISQNLVLNTQQRSVLGDEDEKQEEDRSSENKQEEQKKSEENKREEQKKQDKQQKETAKKDAEKSSSGLSSNINTSGRTFEPIKIKVESEGNKRETEIETLNGQKIKTKIEDDGTTKIEIEDGSFKLKYRIENGQVVLRAENEQGEEVELSDDKLNELEDAVEEDLDDDDIKIASTAGRLVVKKNNVAAITSFPLSVDVETNQLIITTPAGQKIVTVLPDQAVKNLLATGVVSAIEKQDLISQPELGIIDQAIELEIKNNELVYKINGIKTHRIFGLIPVVAPVIAFVSADTGTPVAKQQSFLAGIADFLSP